MTTFVVGTDSVHTSARLCDYLDGRAREGDVVHAANSLPGGDETDADAVRDGEDALNAVSARLGALPGVAVETHQFVRGNRPHEDLLACAREVDADELVVGVRRRNPTAKVVFGSVAQRVLLNADRPVLVVPPEDAESE
jgi:nucleotide-binding universal stress UspA family protein